MVEVMRHPKMRNAFLLFSPERKEKLATLNLALGVKAYREEVVRVDGKEYRVWDPYRSKLAAAITKGMDSSSIQPGVKVLYLGASTGTTVSHVSDLVGAEGRVYSIEVSSRVMHEFINRIVKPRVNVYPIFGDARHPLYYGTLVGEVDVLYCDLAQPDQTEIAIENANLLLKSRGILFLAVKARSIDVTKDLSKVYREEKEKVRSANYKILDMRELDPYTKDHAMITAQKRAHIK